MYRVVTSELRRRLKHPSIYATLWSGLIGAVVYIVMGINDNSSTGAELWLPAVIVPAVTGALWVVTGTSWILMGPRKAESVHCGRCGYDLRHLESHGIPCPECGATGAATTQQPGILRLLTQVPGMLLLLAGVLGLGLALFYSSLIVTGTFDI